MAVIQFKRGLEVNLPLLAAGEPAFTTDTKKVFIGDGETNYFIGGGFTQEAGNIDGGSPSSVYGGITAIDLGGIY